jgi:hypothetical protein
MSCETGKICYDTRAEAENARTAISRRPKGKRADAYLCRFCGDWHLTSSSRHAPNAKRMEREEYRRARRGED